jgi:hypothetical protein
MPEKTRDAIPADTRNLSLKDEMAYVRTLDRFTETNIAPTRHAIADLFERILLYPSEALLGLESDRAMVLGKPKETSARPTIDIGSMKRRKAASDSALEAFELWKKSDNIRF